MRNKIGHKLIFAVGITVIVLISIYAYFNIVSQREVLLAEVERHAIQQSEMVKNSTRYDMLLNRRDHVHRIINTIGSQSSIIGVRILNKEGKIIYSSNVENIGKMVDKSAESCYACHAKDKPLQKLPKENRTRIFRTHPDSSRILGVINPIYTEKSCWNSECHAHSKEQTVLGVLDVTIRLKELDAQIRSSGDKVASLAFATMIAISLIIGVFVKKLITKPVTELVKATKQVAGGNLNYTIEITSQDEIGELEKSFNIMTKKLTEARMQVFQSDKMASLGRLAAGVAHEINNPLTGVLTYSSFLLKRTKEKDQIYEDLKVIVQEAKRSREIVKSLLDFARQSIPRKEPADINDVIKRSLKVVENQLSLNKIKVIENLDKSLPELIVDANQMQQVFINLLVNASDAIGSGGGTITIVSSITSLSPYGNTQIKEATCPNNHNLMESNFKIGNLPSIKLKVKINENEGLLHLDPIYGMNRSNYTIPFSPNDPVELYCPECNISLVNEDTKCPDCNSSVYSIDIPGQGKLQGCTKPGCHWQQWKKLDRSEENQFAEIKISDTGSGIEEEHLTNIFEPFYSTKGQVGTGLGLAVTWGIIDNHRGTITVQSEAGEGSRFIIRLPV